MTQRPLKFQYMRYAASLIALTSFASGVFTFLALQTDRSNSTFNASPSLYLATSLYTLSSAILSGLGFRAIITNDADMAKTFAIFYTVEEAVISIGRAVCLGISIVYSDSLLHSLDIKLDDTDFAVAVGAVAVGFGIVTLFAVWQCICLHWVAAHMSSDVSHKDFMSADEEKKLLAEQSS